MVFRPGHVSSEQLMGLAEGRLDPHVEISARAHVTTCQRCTTELTRVDRLIELMRTDDLEDAPGHVIARAVRLVRPRQPAPSLVRRVLATLSFDSLQAQPVFGLRSGTPMARQLWFNAEDHDLDVRITPVNSQWAIAGQVLGPGTGGRVELRGPTTVQTSLNELSEFTLPSVPSGCYSLRVSVGDMAIEIPDLELG